MFLLSSITSIFISGMLYACIRINRYEDKMLKMQMDINELQEKLKALDEKMEEVS